MGRRSCSSKESVNKGAWSVEENQILTNYITVHGEGKWNSIPQKAGLKRCGKSIRIRWLNYLRPGIKRGDISEDEEDLIIRLHRLLGNRWVLIAKRLPGRTDNEIKNYWNATLVKKLRGKTSCPSLKQFKSKEEIKTSENHDHAPETDPRMDRSSAGFVCDGENNPSASMQVEDNGSLNFLLDFDISHFIVPDISNSNFLQIEDSEVPAEVGSTSLCPVAMVGVNSTSSSFDCPFSENYEVLKENTLQISLHMELMKVASFLDLED